MNYSTFIIKILGKPEQSFFDDNIAVTEIIGKFGQFQNNNKNSDTIIHLSIWGNLAYDAIKYYKENDYVIVEGYISLRKPIFEELYNTNKKQVELSVFKIYPFSLNNIQRGRFDK